MQASFKGLPEAFKAFERCNDYVKCSECPAYRVVCEDHNLTSAYFEDIADIIQNVIDVIME